MRVILTHDRSDFDAIASQIGLLLLHPDAFAIRPLSINANVERYIADHNASIPLRPRDSLAGATIEHAWYVDTDRASDLPGMRPSTPRSLLDHHGVAPSGSDAARWQGFSVEPVGACSTLVVERMIAAGVLPNVVVSTLMLLGIHEDTGSLRHGATTRRDAEAAGWLIEVGADLDQLERYLEKPLDMDSRSILSRLIEDVVLVERHGHLVAVAAASAPGFSGEVAPLAQRLLETQGCEAACALVGLGSIIQLSARSASDAIDVGALAKTLGGGGHRRAAAAALETARHTLDDTRAAVIARLDDGSADGQVLLVQEIMTWGEVVTLSADLTIGAALEVARRHGHEGYPVIDHGDLESMVDRKDLDLAAHHGMLGLPLRSLIARARVVADPTMPASDLIALMRGRGVAHVPVLEGNVLVGIVTRTDLIHALSRQLTENSAPSPSVSLAAAFDAVTSEALRSVAEVAHANGRRVYLVGGIPRDLVLERPIGSDIDLVVDGDAPALGHQVVKALGGELTVHSRFGTAKWSKGEIQIDLVTARAEYYRDPGALPIVQPGSLTSDLRRRDFTINALAVALEGKDFGLIIDRFGGLDDVRTGTVRMLHSLSFVEDATRILRAVRFEGRLGLRMSADTERAARAAAPRLDQISGARITAELKKLFDEPRSDYALERLSELGVLDRIAPRIQHGPNVSRTLRAAPAFWAFAALASGFGIDPQPSADDLLSLWLATLGKAALPTANRLDLPRRTLDRLREVEKLIAVDRLHEGVLPSELHGALEGVSAESRLIASIVAPSPEVFSAVLRFAALSRREAVPIDGADIRRLGVAEGPELGRILSCVRVAWFDGEIADRDAALRLASELIETSEEG